MSQERSADGRRRRGEDNRARIVAAMLEIIQEGEVSPSAEQVAERADVGLRTVFRHFSDMDSLYSEMSEAIEQMIADRAAAKQAKNFAEADRIRDALKAAGIVLDDSASGTAWRRA